MRRWEYTKPSIGSTFLNPFGIVNTGAHFKINRLMHSQMISIQRQQTLLLIPGINQLKHLGPNQIIITINNCHNLATLTQPPRRIINIRQGLLIHLVLNEIQPPLRHIILLDIVSDFLGGAILGGVVDIDDVIVLIVLL